jgi:hypothetical protein
MKTADRPKVFVKVCGDEVKVSIFVLFLLPNEIDDVRSWTFSQKGGQDRKVSFFTPKSVQRVSMRSCGSYDREIIPKSQILFIVEQTTMGIYSSSRLKIIIILNRMYVR